MTTIRAFLNRSFTLGQCFAWIWLAFAVLTLGAHFYRGSEYGLALCVGGILLFLCMDSTWKQYAAAFFLIWGMVEWGESAYVLAKMRMHMGMPWMRGAGILLVVGVVTGLAGKYALSRAAERDEKGSTALFQGVVFICTFLVLHSLRQGAKMEFLLLERYVPLLGSVQMFFVAWYAAWISGKLLDPRQSRKVRRFAWALFAVVFFAQFFLGLFGMERMLLTGKLHVPIPGIIIFAPLFRDSFSVMPFIVLVSTLLAGSAWCSMLCYFGPFDALAAGTKPVRPYPAGLQTALRWGRVVVLGAGVAAALGLRAAGIGTMAAIASATAFGVVSIVLMAVVSRRYGGMVHCTAFCPMGLVANIAGRLSPWRLRVDKNSCDNCGACEKVCRYSAITPESRGQGKTLLRCSLCRDCVGVCKNSALSVSFPGLSAKTSGTIFAGLICVLHAVFLSVAMV